MLLPLVWAACAVAGYLYANQQHIPLALAAKLFPAIILEATFYCVLGIERWRSRTEKLHPALLALALTGAALAPYSAATLALGSFSWHSFLWIAALAVAASFWYVLLPHRPASDLFFLLLMAIVMVAHIFPQLYPAPHPKIPLQTLGQLMWIRTGALAMLSIRKVRGVGFGFWPEPREWRIGAIYYAISLPILAVLAWWIQFAKPRMPSGWERTSFLALATFFGTLWVIALGEEFLFRGLLQQWLSTWLNSEWTGLLAASILFGSVHLWFNRFPNWRFFALATFQGIFYGLAFRQARSIRASMVTHALVVTTWRVFFI
jgi:membrane protease YdiL (CAAX protease family)